MASRFVVPSLFKVRPSTYKSVLSTALAIMIGASAATMPSLSASASSAPACIEIFGTAPGADADAALFHDLSQFEDKDGTRERILAMKKELEHLRHENRNFILPRHFNAEVNLILFQDLLIGGDYEIAVQKFSTLFEETEGSYVLMQLNTKIADKLQSKMAQAPAAKKAQYQEKIDKYRLAAKTAKLSFLDHSSSYFAIRADLETTLDKGTAQETADIMNRVQAEADVHDSLITLSEDHEIQGQPVADTVDSVSLANAFNNLDPAANTPGATTPIVPLTPAVVPPTTITPLKPLPTLPSVLPGAPGAPGTATPVAPPNNALVMSTAKALNRTLGGYLHNDYFKQQISLARRVLGDDLQVERPTLRELQNFDRHESNTTEAILANLQKEIQEQKDLQRALWLKSLRAFDTVGLVIDRLPTWARATAQAFLVYSRDNAVRRTFYRDILTVMREPGEGFDPSRRVEKLFNLAVKYPDDGLLIAYVRVVRSMESWHQMKEFVKSRAYGTTTVANGALAVDSNYARKFDRLVAAEKEAEIRGDLSLTEDVAPAYLKGMVVWSAGAGGIATFASTHPHLFDGLKSFAYSHGQLLGHMTESAVNMLPLIGGH